MDLVLLIKNNMKITKEQIIEALKDRKVIFWSDLLVKLQLLPLFEKYQKEHNKNYDIMKIWLGKTMIDWADSIMKARIKTSKDKRIKYLKEPYRYSKYYLDCLKSQPREAKEDIDYMLLENL